MFTLIPVPLLVCLYCLTIHVSSISKIDGVIGLTAAGAATTKDGVGIAGCWENVTLCMTARRNILSEDRLLSQGYGLCLICSVQIVRLYDSSVVLEGERVNGMPRFRLQDVLGLPHLNTTAGELVFFLDVTDQDKLELAHMTAGHASESVLIEGLDVDGLLERVCANGVPSQRLQRGRLVLKNMYVPVNSWNKSLQT